MATPDDFAAEILQALADADRMTRAGIVAELELLRPKYEGAVEDAANALQDAFKAVEAAMVPISEIDARIADFQAKDAEHVAMLSDPDIENQIVAQVMHDGFLDHLAKLQAKKNDLLDNLRLLEDDHLQAQGKLAAAQGELDIFEVSLKHPYAGYGLATEIYRAYRVGSWGQHVLALEDTLGFERQAWEDSMDALAANTGYRTDKLANRLREIDRESAVEDFRRNFPGAEQSSAPSGQDVVSGIHDTMLKDQARKWREASPDKIEDYRGRPVQLDPHYQVPRASTEARNM